ncbi:hypothetical protein Bhyg_12186 [Pseudolycoriella hygida]|uniref:Uncharacterized protein n=1 Tax=Pseudolycoriella hygida TaxID=35572 RepID=A0A9Q0MWS1_9DIPT|nr:hypothetical protein Bhyg_12186 [Pseudolycoriella hygida]
MLRCHFSINPTCRICVCDSKLVLLLRIKVIRSKRPSPMVSSPYSIWRCKPPGPEQIQLEKMFAEKKSIRQPASMLDIDVKSKIPELGVTRKEIHKPTTPLKEENKDDVEPWFRITFNNASFSTWVYSDRATPAVETMGSWSVEAKSIFDIELLLIILLLTSASPEDIIAEGLFVNNSSCIFEMSTTPLLSYNTVPTIMLL